MPELPEVETIKNTLKQFVVGKTIGSVSVYWENIVKRPDDTEAFKHILTGQKIRDIKRKGKFLCFEMDNYVLVSHLRMEGKYSVHDGTESLAKHTHIIFTFTNGEQLRYNDVRKFGTMHVFPKGKELQEKPLNQLGPDPFEEGFTLPYFYGKLQRTSRAIKAALLDQGIVAGLGNIYVDEVLFKAGIHPSRKSDELTKNEVEAIFKYATIVMQEAVVKGGTTIRSYVNSEGEIGSFQLELLVYGQAGEACKKCGDLIDKIKLAGRGTHFCGTCQK